MSNRIHKGSRKLPTRENALLFSALGDETRLQLLAKLDSNTPQSIKQLTFGLSVTRQAVTKHLRILEKAKLVTQQVYGRERQFVGRKAAIEEAQAALNTIAKQWDDALIRLKNFVEQTP